MKHDLNYYKHPQQNFTKEMVNDTLKYQKKYGFEIGENNLAVDNESDAFRHTYMQAYLSLNFGNSIAKFLGNQHEKSGLQTNGQYSQSSNMDLWNNQQGREIANEIRREYLNFNKLSEQQQKDIIAGKVVQRMKKGKLITGLEDPREFQEQKLQLPFTPTRGVGGVDNNGKPLGFAADIDINQLANMLGIQLPEVQSKQDSGLFGYTNPLTGSNHIYTREEVGSMTSDEFAKHEKEIDAQTKYFNGSMPTNGDLQREALTNGGVVYVNSYTRSNGTEVKGYYRSRPRF